MALVKFFTWSKKPTIKIPRSQNNAVANELDDLNKPLKFPDSPVPAVDDNEKMGHLSKAVCASSSHKRKQARKGLQKPSGKKQKLHDILCDDIGEIDQPLLGMLKKTSAARGKQVQEQSISPSNAGDGSVDEDADVPWKFMVYVQVWSASTTTDKKTGKTSKGPPATITKGPFKSDTAQTFQKFKNEIAKVLPCRPTMLPVSKFEWKFENQAQNAPCKKIADEAGFKALTDAIRVKRTNDNVVVWLYTPKPAKEEE
ncbi:hypothetical protein DFJ58DRAFT_850591, partial [Suillus subalutaceus]|uniref:uncharacterized protein n=1 Tax=Suillus subalutaceus TaxID=48586 RepID=UPI001B866167